MRAKQGGRLAAKQHWLLQVPLAHSLTPEVSHWGPQIYAQGEVVIETLQISTWSHITFTSCTWSQNMVNGDHAVALSANWIVGGE